MTEQQWLTSLLSMPACSETNRAMQGLTGVKYSTGEQDKEMAKPDRAVTSRTHIHYGSLLLTEILSRSIQP